MNRLFRLILPALVAVCGLTFATEALAEAHHRIGGGVHFLRNLGDIEDHGSDPNSYSLIGSYQYRMTLVALEAQAEYILDYAGTGEGMIQPSGWLLVGQGLYGGLGIGIGLIDGDWQEKPFYALRGGFEIALGQLGLDLYATYRFQGAPDFKALTGEDLDSITFAAVLRAGFGK